MLRAKIFLFLPAAFIAGVGLGFLVGLNFREKTAKIFDEDKIFYGSRRENFVIQESASPQTSSHEYLWLNSGGELHVNDGIAMTIQGELPLYSVWRNYYQHSNPANTDDGKRPQNIFRLLSKSKFLNFQGDLFFRITADNYSASPEKNESNGVFLYSRYQDEDGSYYLGLRADGFAIIKKKSAGKYYTLAQKRFFEGDYDKRNKAIILPKNEWIGIKAQTINQENNVHLEFFVKESGADEWELVLEVLDDGRLGGRPLFNEGRAGIRTDFIDAQFDGFSLMGD